MRYLLRLSAAIFIIFTSLQLASSVSGVAYAQATGGNSATRGGLGGIVYDSTGAVMPNVVLSITGPQGTYAIKTDQSGRYELTGVVPGTYKVVVETTGFKKSLVKKGCVVLGEDAVHNEVKYLHGNVGRGTFTFLGGHDPEDYQHAVGDPPTDLSLHVNSPGYRLILNNILFPAAKKKTLKT